MNAAPDRIPAIPIEEHERRIRRADSSCGEIWDLLDAVKDPEIPAISIWDLGVLQDVELDGSTINVTITPTYSGCPAMAHMERDIIGTLEGEGYQATVTTRLAPAWSTAWMSDSAREALRQYGIAPPREQDNSVDCPQCGSANLKLISEFGSTACKALYQCNDCFETFDHFKPI